MSDDLFYLSPLYVDASSSNKKEEGKVRPS